MLFNLNTGICFYVLYVFLISLFYYFFMCRSESYAHIEMTVAFHDSPYIAGQGGLSGT